MEEDEVGLGGLLIKIWYADDIVSPKALQRMINAFFKHCEP